MPGQLSNTGRRGSLLWDADLLRLARPRQGGAGVDQPRRWAARAGRRRCDERRHLPRRPYARRIARRICLGLALSPLVVLAAWCRASAVRRPPFDKEIFDGFLHFSSDGPSLWCGRHESTPELHSTDREHSVRILQLVADPASRPPEQILRRFDEKPKRLTVSCTWVKKTIFYPRV
jgi:hypothetical protein